MEILKHEALETIKGKNRSIKAWSMILALALLATFFVLHSSAALAQESSAGDDPVEVTFTKWITTAPNMAGVVGGAVGTGDFVGEVLDSTPGEVITRIEALYHINGEDQAFTAHMFVWMDTVARTAEIRGVVTEGWMQGSLVRGTFTIISCPDKTDGLCYEGALQLDAPSELEDASK